MLSAVTRQAGNAPRPNSTPPCLPSPSPRCAVSAADPTRSQPDPPHRAALPLLRAAQSSPPCHALPSYAPPLPFSASRRRRIRRGRRRLNPPRRVAPSPPLRVAGQIRALVRALVLRFARAGDPARRRPDLPCRATPSLLCVRPRPPHLTTDLAADLATRPDGRSGSGWVRRHVDFFSIFLLNTVIMDKLPDIIMYSFFLIMLM